MDKHWGKSFQIIYLFLLVLLILNYQNAVSQENNTFTDYRFNKLTPADGLSQSSVLCLFQDKQGFIWLGTKDGLNRFDGYSFKVFKSNPSDSTTLGNNEITCITSDQQGDLLIGTRGGGLNKYVYKKNCFIRLNHVIPNTTTVNTIYFDKDSVLWVGTNAGLMRGETAVTSAFGYRFVNTVQKSIYHDASNHIIPRIKNHVAACSMLQLEKDRYLVGTEYGVFVFNAKELIFKKIDLGVFDISKVTSILKRNSDEYFVATSDGLLVCSWNGDVLTPREIFSTSQPDEHQLNTNYVNALIIDKEGFIWGGCRGGGLFRIDPDKRLEKFNNNKLQESGMNDHVINSLLIDKTGVLWIGTESQGCNLLDLNRKKFKHFDNIPGYNNNINNNLITAITGNGNETLWIGTAYNGISKITMNRNQTYAIEDLPLKVFPDNKNNEIISLLLDSKNNLWIGSMRNNIAIYDNNKNFHVYPTQGYVFSIYEDRENNIWFGTWGNGFSKVDPTTKNIINFNNNQESYQSLSSDKVLSFYEDNYGNLWIGTKGGGVNISPIHLLNQGMSSFVTYAFDDKSKNSLSHNDVYCIFQDSRNDIWIGTGSGLNKLVLPPDENPTEALMQNKATFIDYSEVNGLPNNVIYGILEDQQKNLWVSTINGLAKIRVNDMNITTYSTNDGLQDNEFHANAYFGDKTGNLYFGGINGVSFFNPNNIQTNPFSATINITGLKVLNQEVIPNTKIIDRVILTQDISTTKKLTLGPKHKEFTIEFSGMHYSNMDNIRYAYRLKGFDDEWRQTLKNQHSATYTNILEGHYTFQVKATNNDGVWSNDMAELKITIKPVIWRNPWFFLFYLGLIFTLLFFFRKYSVIAVKEKNKLKLEAFERQKTIELTEAKMRFFTNISHEIRTPLTLIYSPLEKVLQNTQLDEKTQKSLSLVKKNVDRLLNLTNQLLQLRKIDIGLAEPQFEKVNFIPYLKDILEYFDQQFKSKEIAINLSFEFESTNDEIWIDKEMMTTALYNLVSNAIKYTPQNGSISIRAFITPNDTSRKLRKKNKKQVQIDQFLNIEINDNGIGIPTKEIPNVFNRFYQASNHGELGQAGSGIGLSIVKEYIDLHHGNIAVSSLSGKGTTFMVQLPLGNYHIPTHQFKNKPQVAEVKLPDEIRPVMDESESVIIETIYEDNDQRPLVLIAEDDAEMLSFLVQNMSENYRLITAVNGKQAWNKLIHHMPNLIISDIMMPEMDGRELCNKIKSNMETSHIPIILLSAHAANEDIIEGYGQGADRYVSKPFALDVLEAQVNQLLTTRKQLIELYSTKILLKPREITITSMDEKFLTKIMDITEENISDPDFDIATIVNKMNMSHSSVLKKIKALTGVSLVEFVRRHRLNKAAMILEQDKLPITEVAYMTGFSDPKYFSKCFSKQFGKTPTEYANEFEGE